MAVDPRRRWTRFTSRVWVIDDGSGNALQAAQLGPYLGQAGPTYRVTGVGYKTADGNEYSDHATLEEAMAAAEASLGPSGP